MSNSKKNTDQSTTKRVSSPRTKAGPCPLSDNHTNTMVYRTQGRVRRCKCNDCGHTWKLTGPFADALREYAMTLAESLAATDRVDAGDGPCVVIEDDLAKKIEKDLRQLAAT